MVECAPGPERIGIDVCRKVRTWVLRPIRRQRLSSVGSWPGAMDLGLLGAADDESMLADAAAEAQASPRPGAGRLGVVTALQTEADCLRHLR